MNAGNSQGLGCFVPCHKCIGNSIHSYSEIQLRLECYKKMKEKNADYILIGAGAGLSVAAGLEYVGENFQKNYSDFIKKYHFDDLYTATFYLFNSQEEKWAFWARLINLNRFNSLLKLYEDLLELIKGKEYFIITTNVDGQFENAIWRNKINKKWYSALLIISERKLGLESDKIIDIIDLRYSKDKIKEISNCAKL